MPTLKYIPIATDQVNKFKNERIDHNQQVPEQFTSDGCGVPCRHCLTDIDKGESCLLLGYRPFPGRNAYAETGPVFIHADHCQRYDSNEVPQIINSREQFIIRGYDDDDRIIEGTGKIIDSDNIEAEALTIFANQPAKYLHIRSATNNCYFCRIELKN